jgi:protein lifeguard
VPFHSHSLSFELSHPARVYAILSVQLAVTVASCVLFGLNPGLGRAMRQGSSAVASIPTLGLILSTIAWIWIASSPNARQKAPLKWNLLAMFTVGEALTVGFISSFYKFQSVAMAMGATALATITVSAYTILQRNPNRDLSQWGAGLSSCTLIFLVYGLIGLLQTVGWLPAGFLPYSDMMYSAIGAGLFSFYLAYHTKLIVGGKHAKYQMNERDYVYAAMALYTDIINIFLYILRVIGEDRER